MPDDMIPKLREREYLEVQERRTLSKWEFATLFLQQQGKCAVCSARLEQGKVRDEHLHALHLGGGNELTNRALWCLDCTKPKDVMDKARIAKGKRIRGLTGQAKRRRERGHSSIKAPAVSALSKDARGYVKRKIANRGWGK